MSYDLHGTWDAASKFMGPYIGAHTNLTEIDLGLDLLWRAGVKPQNVVLGQGFYGRSFTLKDPKCNTPNGVCQFTGGAKAGKCSKAEGILNIKEILDLVNEKKLTPVHDKKAGVKWITWDSNQWVSYDDEETLVQKGEFANSRCLGGLMIWAIDQIDQKALSLANPFGMTEEEVLEAEIIYQDEAARGVCYTTKCGEKCRNGDHEAGQTTGQPGQVEVEAKCNNDEVRRVCCNKGTIMGKCQWRGYRGLAMSCFGGCKDGEVEVTENVNHRTDKEDHTCTGGTQSFCCAGFRPPVSKEQIEEGVKDAAADMAKEAAAALALEVAAKAFCRVAIMAATAPLRFIPFVGIFISIALQAAMPALVNVCSKGIAKAGKGVFKFKGKEYDVPLDKPLETKVDRDAPKSTTKAPNKSKVCTRGLEKRVPRRRGDGLGTRIMSTTTLGNNPIREMVTKTCWGDRKEGLACYHYKSVIDHQPGNLAIMECPGRAVDEPARPDVDRYNAEHDLGWIYGYMQKAGLNCERDEYPPAGIWRGRSRAWIRLTPHDANNEAGKMFIRVCPKVQEVRDTDPYNPRREEKNVGADCIETTTIHFTVRPVLKSVSIEFRNMGGMPADYGIEANPCWPKRLVPDPGFALLTDDPWYDNHQQEFYYAQFYSDPPPLEATANEPPLAGHWKKRSVPTDPEDIVIEEGNSTRKPTREELLEHFGVIECKDDACSSEMAVLGFASLPAGGMKPTSPAEAPDVTTTPYGTLPTSLSSVLDTATLVSDAAHSVITTAAVLDEDYHY